MKKTILGLLVLFILIFVFTGCQEKGLSIEERIEAFIKDLNGTRLNLKEHFSSSGAFAAANGTVLNSLLPSGHSYGKDSISGSGSTRSVVIKKDGSNLAPFNFKMKEDKKDDWYIESIY